MPIYLEARIRFDQRRERMRTGHLHPLPDRQALMKARRLAKCSLRALACCRHLNCRRLLTARSDVTLGLVCAPLGPALLVLAPGAMAEAGAALIVAGGSV